MKRAILFALIFQSITSIIAQDSNLIQKNESIYLMPEFLYGYTNKSNFGFPENTYQKNYLLTIGRYHYNNHQEWTSRLNYPKTGVTLGFIDLGNKDILGYAVAIYSTVEFDLSKRFHLGTGLGGSYVNTLYDPVTNPTNKGITRHLNWTFRFLASYDIIDSEHTDWRLGIGYTHHSNGHTRIPNQGLNSFLVSTAVKFDTKRDHEIVEKPVFDRTVQTFISTRFGLGLMALSEEFNYVKPNYTFAASYGKIINRTFKFGIGMFYRFYTHYYDYIVNEEELIVTDYPFFTEKPVANASAFGVYGSFELLMSHVSAELGIGLNISKPFYAIDYQITEGGEFVNEMGETVEYLGQLDREFDSKRVVSGRIGLKYYLKSNEEMPEHNWFIGAHINSNLGRADFSELSLGYVYQINIKKKEG